MYKICIYQPFYNQRKEEKKKLCLVCFDINKKKKTHTHTHRGFKIQRIILWDKYLAFGLLWQLVNLFI